jgi:hypothetical protein
MAQTMNQVRDKIASDFSARYGTTFNISTIFVPDLLVPPEDREAEPITVYRGSRSWKNEFGPAERKRFDISSERLKAQENIDNIRKRYRFR